MYRLPTQFDASASRQDLAAAGGGSTSTTCSSCVVTLIGSSVLSAVVLGSLDPVAPASSRLHAPAVVDAGEIETHATANTPTALSSPDSARHDDVHTQPVAPSPGMSKVARILLGVFALPLAATGGGVFMGTISPLFGLFVALGIFVGIYAIVHERTGRSLGRGIGIGIAVLVGLCVVGALEMMLWLSLMT